VEERAAVTLALVVATTVMAGQTRSVGAPEVFNVNAQVKGAAGAAAATLQVHIDRYTPDADRTAVEDALKHGGYANFLNALRKAPEVGRVQSGERLFPIRWARQTNTKDGGRTIVVVTDKPIFFIGGAAADAKPRAGYDVGLIQMTVDGVGFGSGTMAGAARIRPGGEAGVQVLQNDGKRVRVLFTPEAREAVEKVKHVDYVERVAASDNLRDMLGGASPASNQQAFGEPAAPGAAPVTTAGAQ